MTRTQFIMIGGAMMLLAGSAFASGAWTSAEVDRRNAGATAEYEGDRGFARTDTRTGDVNLARGVAVGADRDGVSLSISHAVNTKGGKAVGTNVNMSLGRDGQRALSYGTATDDSPARTVSVGGGSSLATRSRDAGVRHAVAPRSYDRHAPRLIRSSDDHPVGTRTTRVRAITTVKKVKAVAPNHQPVRRFYRR